MQCKDSDGVRAVLDDYEVAWAPPASHCAVHVLKYTHQCVPRRVWREGGSAPEEERQIDGEEELLGLLRDHFDIML